MPKNISAAQQLELAKAVTSPVYLVELQFNTPVYLSSRQEVTYDSNIYEPNKIISVKTNTSPKGIMSGTVSISNIDLSIGAIALTETLQGKVCNISTIHSTGSSAALADVTPLIEGVVSGVSSISDTEVILSINSINSNIMYSPRIYCSPSLFNHAIPVGTIITWGNTTYELVGAK